ncbi:membrane protein FxsA [Halobacteria archaeon AArc-curdl1]|uniref:Membrane protein FxsA n=1 Tax=Natronosalvus hydrolyticus TaxID=2979988 RepID=A0AAP2Z925_9EURY|nr:membrane protein FxsA [Halobacteria archaeon AArc-curdl1]
MLRWILALLVIPFLDAVLLAVVVTQYDPLSWVGMIALVVLTGLVGMLLVRAEGRRTLRKTQRSLAAGTPPTNQLLDGALLIAAGAFLLTPGLVTDLIGFLLVVPPTRIPIRMALKRFVVVPYLDRKTDDFTSGVVWTAGFPDEQEQRASWSGSSGGYGPTQTRGDESAGDSTSSDDTVDLGEDDYSVNTDDTR